MTDQTPYSESVAVGPSATGANPFVVTKPQRCTEPHDCGRYLPHHAECCPCAQGMSERWADAANRLLRVVEAATDLLWKATQYGETEDGDTAAYLLPKGTVHRLIGAVQGAGFSAALRADSGVTTARCTCFTETVGTSRMTTTRENCPIHGLPGGSP